MTNRNNRRRRAKRVLPDPYPFAYPPVQAYPPPVPVVPNNAPPPSLSVQVLQDKNASVAKVVLNRLAGYNYGDGNVYNYEVTGSAKREQGDRYDPVTGEKLALARTFQELADELRRDANKAVNELVREREEAQIRAAERKARKAKPQIHKPREVWERQQQERQLAANARLARNLGLKIMDSATPVTSAADELRSLSDRVNALTEIVTEMAQKSLHN